MIFARDVLILSPYPASDLARIVAAIEATGDRPRVAESIGGNPDWIISYGHRQIIPRETLHRFKDRIGNLHISFLPWGRGADPNYWAWRDDEPHGVSLHYMDEGIDTGDLIAQRMLTFGDGETLQTSYHRKRAAVESLFAQQWPSIRAGYAMRQPQRAGGSCHRIADRPEVDWTTKGVDIARDRTAAA